MPVELIIDIGRGKKEFWPIEDTFLFPVGEINAKAPNLPVNTPVDIRYTFDGSDSIMELLQTVDALRRMNVTIGSLHMSYVPFSRQDRVMNKGESFSLKVFCDLINGLNFRRVFIDDPHSDVTSALLNNVVVRHQHDILAPEINTYFEDYSYYLVSPDGGALKKTYKLAEEVKCKGVIECSKRRNVKTGEITGLIFHDEDDLNEIYSSPHLIIVDDIADGGMTFIKLSEEIRSRNYGGKIILMVTHGFFTKGLDCFAEIDKIWCSNNGWVKL